MSTYGDLKISTINGGALSGFRNAIINGNFGINQRGVSGTVSLAAGAYGHDRWKAGASGCTYTFATSENVTTITISAGSLIQVVEGLNLQTGDYTLSWQGTAQGKIGAGSYGNSGITGAATGGTNLNIEFGTGTISLVQLEKGTVATPFEFRSIGQELALCQRYFQKIASGAGGLIGSAWFWTSTVGDVYIPFKTSMRASPSVSQVTGTNYFNFQALSTAFSFSGFAGVDMASPDGVALYATGLPSGTTGATGYMYTTNAASFLAMTAEL